MKIFFANLATETNTFSPIPTGHAGFHDVGYHRRDGSLAPAGHGNIAQIEWRRLCARDGHAVAESISAFAQPAGTTLRHVYEKLRDDLLADLKAAMQEAGGPVDVVLMKMHGAMVAYGYDDCEGDTCAEIRKVVGPDAIIGLELDLHCHLTEVMRSACNAIITYKEYPHVDVGVRAVELYDLCVAARLGKVKPAMAYYDCRMVSMWRTPVEPMKSFVARMQALEGHDGVLSVSFGHGFPWGDVEDVGARMLVVTDNDKPQAERIAAELGRELFDKRHAMAPKFMSMDEALDAALAEEGGPIVVADVSDNAGGGAPGDSTYLLQRVFERGIRNVASSMHWDPIAVRFCREAGVGETLDLRIGGKSGKSSGMPLDLRVTVKGLVSGITQRFGTVPVPIGDAAWVHADGVDIVLASIRTQTFHPEVFTKLGLDPTTRKLLLVKSIYHFQAGFAPIAKRILFAATPGALQPRFSEIPYTKLKTPYWPKVEDPWAA